MVRIAPQTAILVRRAIAQAQVIDLASGSTLFSVPCDPDTEFLADGGLLTARGRDDRLRTWDLGHARPLWHSRLEGLEPVARAGDGVFALTVGGDLVLLDRSNGSIRQAYRRWTFVSSAVSIGDLLALHVRKARGDAIAAIGLGSGRILWETDLPPGLAVHGELHANGDRIVAELRHLEESPTLFIVDEEGNLVGGHRFEQEETPLITRDAIFFAGPDGLRSVRPGTRKEAAAPVPATRIPAEGEFAASLPGPAELGWQELGGASYAIGLRGEHLVAFIRFPSEGGARRTEIRLAHAANRPWQEPQTVRIDRGGSPELIGRDRGWRILDSRRLELGEGEWGAAVLLAPPILRDPLATFHCRATSDRDGDDAPWWLPSSWHEIAPP